MTEFLLVFRHEDRDFYEVRDTTNGEAHMNGTRLADGATFEHRGSVWLATREDLEEGSARFVLHAEVKPSKPSVASPQPGREFP
jgi:hypothetical protein